MSEQQPVEKLVPSTLRALEQHYEHLYASEAERYDAIRYRPAKGQRRNQLEQAAIAALIGFHEGQSVLDAPAGTGRVSTYLAERGARVTALDLTEPMVREARAIGARRGLAGLDPVVGNARLLPFADNTFDAAISIRFFHLLPVHLHRPFLLDLYRVVRPGGVMLAQFYSASTLGGLTWPHELYRRTIAGRKPRYYLWPHQIPALFEGLPTPTIHSTPPDLNSLPDAMADSLHNIAGTGTPRLFLNRRVFLRTLKR